MKKLMFAMAVACAAVVANAATVNWSGLNAALSPDVSTPASYSIYLVDKNIGVETALATIMAGETDGIYGQIPAANIYAVGTTAFRWSNSAQAITGTWDTGDTINAYSIILDSTVAKNAKNYLATDPKSAQFSSAGSATLGYGSQAGKTWTAVPEPTSGLLLLLGVAGLALKRKRA